MKKIVCKCWVKYWQTCGVNTIKSGTSCAGIDVIDGETLEITGTSSLTVTGGQYGADIGTGETTVYQSDYTDRNFRSKLRSNQYFLCACFL